MDGLGEGELWQISAKKKKPRKHQTMNLFPLNLIHLFDKASYRHRSWADFRWQRDVVELR
jgi:hypothetical protein